MPHTQHKTIVYSEEHPESDIRNCPQCLIGMEIKGYLYEGEGVDPSKLVQCPKCKNVEIL